MVHGADVMLLVDIDTPSKWSSQFNHHVNNVGIKCITDLVDEVRDITHVQEFAAKQRAARRYSSKVMLR